MKASLAREIVKARLAGMHTNFSEAVFLELLHHALCRIADECLPLTLVATTRPERVYRSVDDLFVRQPAAPALEEELDIDGDLQHAAINIVCANLASEGKEWFIKEAERLVRLYQANREKDIISARARINRVEATYAHHA